MIVSDVRIRGLAHHGTFLCFWEGEFSGWVGGTLGVFRIWGGAIGVSGVVGGGEVKEE